METENIAYCTRFWCESRPGRTGIRTGRVSDGRRGGRGGAHGRTGLVLKVRNGAVTKVRVVRVGELLVGALVSSTAGARAGQRISDAGGKGLFTDICSSSNRSVFLSLSSSFFHSVIQCSNAEPKSQRAGALTAKRAKETVSIKTKPTKPIDHKSKRARAPTATMSVSGVPHHQRDLSTQTTKPWKT